MSGFGKVFVISFLLLAAIFSTLNVYAHPPENMELEYDIFSQTLKVQIEHRTSNPFTHYVERIVVEVNGMVQYVSTYPSQPTPSIFPRYISPIIANYGDLITATAYCNKGGSISRTIVAHQNTPPVANDDYANVDEDSSNNQIDVLANDYDIDGDKLSITSVSTPSHGTAYHDGSYVYYTPDANYYGIDSFTYTITDGNATDTATVYINVRNINDPPVVVIAYPKEGQEVKNTVRIKITAYDIDIHDRIAYQGVHVSFDSSGEWYRTEREKDYWYYDWDTTNFAEGEHTIHARATDGKDYGYDTVNVTVNNDPNPPSLNINKPKEGCLYIFDREIMSVGTTIIIGKITIKADAYDAESGMDRVEFYINDELKYTDVEVSYEWIWGKTPFGIYEIKVVAYDKKGNSSNDSLTVLKMF